MSEDEKFMKRAIELARLAALHKNEPFGAVLVKDGQIVFENENSIYTDNDHTAHAELGLIKKFCKKTGITDLSEYTLYSSCEPCYMCSGAMVWAKLGRLVYGASDIELSEILGSKGGECSKDVAKGSFYFPKTTAGVLKEESLQVLKDYFKSNKKG